MRSNVVMIRAISLLLCTTVAGICQDTPSRSASAPRLHRIVTTTPQELQELFRSTDQPLPLLSAHRGGPARGHPENCIATLEHTLRHTFALLEVDPRYAKDGEIVVHHDADLRRTTTGQGLVADHTLAQLQELRLKDAEGQVTEFQIPTLDEVLEWARGKTVLVLDQKDVPASARVRKIEEHKAEAFAMLIAYSFKDAQECYALNPNIMMEVMIPSHEKLKEFDRTGVPWRNVVAFVGHSPPEDASLYAAIHAKGARCIVGSSRNLDRRILSGEVTDIGRLEADYRSLLKRGADLIETDLPVPLGKLLYSKSAVAQDNGSIFRVD